MVALIVGAQPIVRALFCLTGREVDKTLLEGPNLWSKGQTQVLVQVGKSWYKNTENRCSVIRIERRFPGAQKPVQDHQVLGL